MAVIGLHPEDIGLDACGEAAMAYRLRDYVAASLLFEKPFTEDVDDMQLRFVESERDDGIRIRPVCNEILLEGPVVEIIGFSEGSECLSCCLRTLAVECYERGDALDQKPDLRKGFHLQGQEEGPGRD